MKYFTFTLLITVGILTYPKLGSAQPSSVDIKSKFAALDFSKIFTVTDNQFVYGFIGDNYQRLRIKFISVTKDPSTSNVYNVYGKLMVKDNICEFDGTLTFTTIKKNKKMSYGVDDEYKNKGLKGEFEIVGVYEFKENPKQKYPGIFSGHFRSSFYLDKYDKIHYNDIDSDSDGFSNNEFTGEWIADKGTARKKSNWGDYRIPNDGDLDIGAGEFSPADKYLKYGWQSVRDLLESSGNSAEANKIEHAKWWK